MVSNTCLVSILSNGSSESSDFMATDSETSLLALYDSCFKAPMPLAFERLLYRRYDGVLIWLATDVFGVKSSKTSIFLLI